MPLPLATIACDSSSRNGPCKISPINIGMLIGVIIVQVLLRQSYHIVEILWVQLPLFYQKCTSSQQA